MGKWGTVRSKSLHALKTHLPDGGDDGEGEGEAAEVPDAGGPAGPADGAAEEDGDGVGDLRGGGGGGVFRKEEEDRKTERRRDRETERETEIDR